MVLIISFEVVVILKYSGTNYADCWECSCCKYVMNSVLPALFLLHNSVIPVINDQPSATSNNANKVLFFPFLNRLDKTVSFVFLKGKKLAS